MRPPRGSDRCGKSTRWGSERRRLLAGAGELTDLRRNTRHAHEAHLALAEQRARRRRTWEVRDEIYDRSAATHEPPRDGVTRRASEWRGVHQLGRDDRIRSGAPRDARVRLRQRRIRAAADRRHRADANGVDADGECRDRRVADLHRYEPTAPVLRIRTRKRRLAEDEQVDPAPGNARIVDRTWPNAGHPLQRLPEIRIFGRPGEDVGSRLRRESGLLPGRQLRLRDGRTRSVRGGRRCGPAGNARHDVRRRYRWRAFRRGPSGCACAVEQ